MHEVFFGPLCPNILDADRKQSKTSSWNVYDSGPYCERAKHWETDTLGKSSNKTFNSKLEIEPSTGFLQTESRVLSSRLDWDSYFTLIFFWLQAIGLVLSINTANASYVSALNPVG